MNVRIKPGFYLGEGVSDGFSDSSAASCNSVL